MPLFLIRQDITLMETDCIVNAANSSLLGGGGVDGAIHRAAGPALLEECRGLGGCPTGEVRLTRGYRLKSPYIIHTVGPVWQGGKRQEEALLRNCYRNSLALAGARGFRSLAFPLISAGVYGYPKQEALRIAQEEIVSFLENAEMTVYLCLFDREAVRVAGDIEAYITDHYVEKKAAEYMRSRSDAFPRLNKQAKKRKAAQQNIRDVFPNEALCDEALAPSAGLSGEMAQPAVPNQDLEDKIAKMDLPFSRMLLELIDEKGISDAACYTRANIDRRLFSKIRSNSDYRPAKNTVFAFCFGLQLSLAESERLLKAAGFAFSNSSLLDVIVRYFLENKNYDIFELNQVLFSRDLPLLGSN